jgi:CBS domain containing-hemolysin-like protein
MVHVLPEKIAEKRNHPQAEAIKTLCILSLFFGGILWPLAWLWTYSKPVFYKMAYGTDKGAYHEQTMEDLERQKELDSDPKNSSKS